MFQLRNSLGKAKLAELKVLIDILHATSKGAIPVKKHRYDKIIVNRQFSQVIKLKDENFYHTVRNLERSELVDFINGLMSVWKLYLFPLFELSQDD